MKYRGETYLPAWYGVDKRRLHTRTEISLMNLTREVPFSNPVLRKFVFLDITNHFLIP